MSAFEQARKEMIGVLQRDFEIVETREWGGNLLQFLLDGIAGNFSEKDSHSQALLSMLVNIEDTLLQCGELKSDFAYIVARRQVRSQKSSSHLL